MKKIILITAFALLMSGCSAAEEISPTPEITVEPISQEEMLAEEIQEVYNLRLDALIQKDIDTYMTTVSQSDEYYYNEQKRWFTEMTTEGFSDIEFVVEDIEIISDEKIIATIHQTHFYIESFDITYPIVFIKENNIYMDTGYDFLVHESNGYTIKYQEGETKVDDFDKIIQKAYDNLALIFTETPDPNFQIKLYHDREMLRQRTIPSIQWLFTGWGEANESLKLYTGHPSLEGYEFTIQHELVHHITMRICNNNLPGWMADGIAMHYGNFALSGGNAIEIGAAKKENIMLSIEYLETADMWSEQDREVIDNWYFASEMYVEYIVEEYGHDTLMALFYEGGKKPYNEKIMNPEFKEQNAQTMEEVFVTILNKTKEEITADYLVWLDENY